MKAKSVYVVIVGEVSNRPEDSRHSSLRDAREAAGSMYPLCGSTRTVYRLVPVATVKKSDYYTVLDGIVKPAQAANKAKSKKKAKNSRN